MPRVKKTQKENMKNNKKVIKTENMKNNKQAKTTKKSKSPKKTKPTTFTDILLGNDDKKNNEKEKKNNNSKKRKENPNIDNEIPKRKRRKIQNKRKQPPQDLNINNKPNNNSNNHIDIIESFKELDEKKSFGISKIDPVKIVSIQNLVSKKNNNFISVYVSDALNYIVQILIFGEDVLTFGYKIGDNVQLQFDNQNVSKGKYHKGVLRTQIVHCKFETSLLNKEIGVKIDMLSNVADLSSKGQKYFNFIVKVIDTEKIGSKPHKKHEVFDDSGAAMLIEWNSFNYKGLTFNIEPNNIYLIMSAEVTVHERYGINLQNYVITKPSIFTGSEKYIKQLKNINKQSKLNITKESFENIGTTNAFNCIKYQKFSKYKNIILYGCKLNLIDVGVIHGKKEDGTYVGLNQLDKMEVDEYNQLDIEFGIKINITDEDENIWEDGYINNKIASNLLNIQPKDFWNQTDDFKNNIFNKIFAQEFNIYINFFEGKNKKIKFKICYIDVNDEEEYESCDDEDNDDIDINNNDNDDDNDNDNDENNDNIDEDN